jgi:hypothetical protein
MKMKTKTVEKEDVVASLVGRYAKRLGGLDARGLRAEWDLVFGDEFPDSAAAAIDLLTRDHEEWMGALEALELEAVWEDQLGQEIHVIDRTEKTRGKKQAA